MWKTVNILIIICFAYFAYVQLNDKDGLLWLLIYSAPIAVAFLALINKSSLKITRFGFMLFGLLTLIQVPTLIEWFEQGQPNFIDYQPTEIKIAEKMRELLGVVITSMAIGVLHWQNKLKN